MYKYEIDPSRIVGATEQTQDAGRTDGRRTDGRTEWNQYIPQQLHWVRGITRTTRIPVFRGYPPLPHDFLYYWFILDPKSKQDKIKVTNLKNLPKLQIFKFENKFLYGTHLLKLLDMMCKYEMDLACIVEDTEWTRFCPQMDRRTEVGMDRRTRWNQYTPLQLIWGGYN